MTSFNRAALRFGAAAVAIGGLVATGVTGAHAAPRAENGQPVNEVRLAITDNGFYVDSASSIPAGRVMLKLDDARKSDTAAVIARLATGYSFQDLRSDLKIAFENLFAPHGDKKKGLKHLNHALANVTAYGGVLAHGGSTAASTVLLDQPGQYVVWDDTGNLPRRAHLLTVGSPSGSQVLPTTKATVVAMTNRRFGGASTLPGHGYITFKNVSTESPHFLDLQHVKSGTTRKQVIESFQSNAKPNFVLPGDQSLELLSPGRAQVVQLHLPPGLYAEFCFFPDPKTGMPHALMGMVRMVHVK